MQIKSRLLLLALTAYILLLFLLTTSNLGLALPISLKLSATAMAQSSNPNSLEPLILNDQQSEYPLGLHLQILEDPTGKLAIDDVSSPAYNSQFIPNRVNVPNYGFTNSAYWVRFQLENKSQQNDEWLLEESFSNMQYVDLYSPMLGQSGYTVKQTGSLRPVSTRDVLSPNIVFKLSVPNGGQQTYYMRFQNGASMTLALSLWTEGAFSIHSQRILMLYWLYFGIIIALLIYHLFLLFTIRERTYLFFVILLTSLLIEELSYNSYLETYLLPSLAHLRTLYYPWAFLLLNASVILFSDAFLESRSRLPKLHWVNMVLLVGWVLFMLLIPFVSYHSLAVLIVPCAVFSFSLTFIGGFLTWKQGFHPARFFMIAWFGMIMSFSLVFLVRLGLIPSTLYTENSYHFGIIWMAVCWSIALAERINLLKAETENAYRELKASEHRLSQILNGLPLGVLLYGKDQKPKYGNQRVYDIFNDPSRNVQVDLEGNRTLAQAIPYFSLKQAGTDQDYPVENFPISSALRGRLASTEDIEIDRGDNRIALEIQASPVLNASGEVESAVVAVQDISQRKKAEAELDEYRRRLETLVEKRTAELTTTNEQLVIEASERKALELALQQRIEWLSMVNNIHQTITGATSLTEAYEDLSAKILELLSAAFVFIVHWADQDKPLDIFYYPQKSDITPDPFILNSAFQQDSPIWRNIELGKNIIWSINQTGLLPAMFARFFVDHDIQSAIFIPQIVHKSVIGVLCVAGLDISQGVVPHQLNLIERMAFDLADIAQDAALLDQNKTLITAEERNRLARELHDSVTQTLFSASILAEATPRIWDKDQGIARQNMDKLSVLIRGALAEMRSMLIELRADDLHRQTLKQLLVMLVEATRARSNALISIKRMDTIKLPGNIAMTFYRVAREAVNNAIVHAEASEINLSLIAGSGQVELHIEDDGYGFDPQAVGEGHLGIRIMQERAAMIGGKVEIVSEPGKGTKIVVSWSNDEGGTVEYDRSGTH